MGRGLGRVGGVWGFPGRQTGSRRSRKGVLCGDGLGCTEPQGLLRERWNQAALTASLSGSQISRDLGLSMVSKGTVG